jgi:4'-phosphopantetheinyl transferase
MKQATRELSCGLPQAFSLAPPALTLGPDEIHIWWANLDLPEWEFHKFAQTLSIDERKRATRFHFEESRRRYIARHGILRSIVGSYLKIEPRSVQFCYGKYGKPGLANNYNSGSIHFNLSHSAGFAIYGFLRKSEIGLDIERVRKIPEMEQIVEQFFSARENETFRALPRNQKKMAFFEFWTRKEAFIKATGKGMYEPLDKCNATLVAGERAELIRIGGESIVDSQWFIQDLKPAPGFAAALAVGEEIREIRCWQWSSAPGAWPREMADSGSE